MSTQLGFDEAFDLIVEYLRGVILSPAGTHPDVPHGAHLSISIVAARVANERSLDMYEVAGAMADAVAELCRIGVLRIGFERPIVDRSYGGAGYEIFSLTSRGRTWVLEKPAAIPRDPGSIAMLIHDHAAKFGRAFALRAGEAIGCYRSSNYLAACAMCGAAAESILLALGRAKLGELEADKIYFRASGRKELINKLTYAKKGDLISRLLAYADLLSYWRDNAAHGGESDISEPQASMAIDRMLRFAQFASENWGLIIAP